MEQKIRAGDLIITRARMTGVIMAVPNTEEKVVDPNAGDEITRRARSKVMCVTGHYREDDGCPETMLMSMREFPERSFWLPLLVIDKTYPMTMEYFRAEYETTFDKDNNEVRKVRPLVCIEYVFDPNQGRIITNIKPKN